MTGIWKADWVEPRSAALLVVDVQQGFVNRHSRGVLPAIVQLIESWRAAGAPVVLTRFHNKQGSPYETITGWTRLRSPEEQALATELAPFAADATAIIDKDQASVFTPEGAQLIRAAGWTDLVLCGIDTDACVYDSARDAYHYGYRPWIVTDACASTGGAQYHDAALLMAARNISPNHLVTSESVLSRITGPKGASA
ncbi:isochorismatase family cysteine hydrolase [Streptomyces sp. CdTB01]|uniref:isochorismatase family cysteine hydrolase n=1 Tax=Streptomyces sp. CdTB01 TaxID=1725411 RepID=UPI00073A5ABC|nr:isochorismatase family cysteine hydrolase [Streptomyces sp. CdTB01]ALV39305.1 hydrolase [Streptomyces sp. CdTB01]